jgi:4-hydroxyphenylpyruvate dioxygenase
MTISPSPSSTLKGYEGFIRTNPKSDKITARQFHHVEFYCGDSTTTYKRFMFGLGLDLIAKSDLSTGNSVHSSYVLQSGELRMMFTAPYFPLSTSLDTKDNNNIIVSTAALIDFNRDRAINFTSNHGLGVCAVCIEVDNVTASYNALLNNGGQSISTPTINIDNHGRGWTETAEVHLYGDVVLRLLNTDSFKGLFMSNFIDTPKKDTHSSGRFGLTRFDHIVGNLWSLEPKMTELINMTVFTFILHLYSIKLRLLLCLFIYIYLLKGFS